MPLYAQALIQLPAQPLAASLLQLQREAGVNIIAASEVVAGRNAPAVSGKLPVTEALERMLSGSDLKAEQVAPGTFVIKKSLPARPPAPAPKTVREGEVPISTLATVKINGELMDTEGSFVEYSSRGATRTNASLADTPMAVQVINKEFIKSIQAQSVAETLAYISNTGVTSAINGAPEVSIRGSSAAVKTNGIGDSGPTNSLSIPMAGIERVEVVKGAASILSGAMAPGGMVNVQLKRPTAKRVREATVQAGSYGNLLAAVDLGGAISNDQRLSYRLIVSGETADESFMDYDGERARYVAPSIGWKSRDTQVILGYQYQYSRRPVGVGTILELTGPAALSGRPTPRANSNSTSNNLSFEVEHKLSPIFQYENETLYQRSEAEQNRSYTLLGGMDGMGIYNGVDSERRFREISFDNRIKAEFATGPVNHTTMLGFAYNRLLSKELTAPPLFFMAPFPLLNPEPFEGPREEAASSREHFRTAYYQHQLAWGRWHVLAGIGRGTYVSDWTGKDESQSKWTPSFGVVYKLTDAFNLYANVMKSYQPGQGLLDDGTLAPPESGRSMEVGVKSSLLNDRLTINADIYEKTLDHSLRIDFQTGGFYIGEAYTYRGIEFDVVGRPMPGMNVTASYAYTKYLANADFDADAYTPHTGSLWLTYDAQGEKLRGWGGGIGFQARGSYRADTFSGVKARIPGHVKTDLSLYYKARTWSATLGVKNLADSTMYEDGGGARVNLLPGRLVYLTGTFQF